MRRIQTKFPINVFGAIPIYCSVNILARNLFMVTTISIMLRAAIIFSINKSHARNLLDSISFWIYGFGIYILRSNHKPIQCMLSNKFSTKAFSPIYQTPINNNVDHQTIFRARAGPPPPHHICNWYIRFHFYRLATTPISRAHWNRNPYIDGRWATNIAKAWFVSVYLAATILV